MFPALGALTVYGFTAALALGAAHRWVLRVPLRAALLLAAAPLLFTGPAIVTGGIFAPVDIAYQAEPLKALAAEHGVVRTVNPLLVDVVSQMLPSHQALRDSVFEGRLPLWNRCVLAGEPLLGLAQPAIFHPATALGLLLPLPQAWNFEVSVRLLIGLACAYLFFRGIGAAEAGAMLGAFAWAFSDFLFFFVGYPLTTSVAPFPLLALALLRLAHGAGRAAVGLTVFALVLTVVAGHPETLLFSVTGAGLLFVFELSSAKPGARLRPVLLALGAGAMAAGLTAVVLLPFLEILPQTLQHVLRSHERDWSSTRSETPVECLRRLVPSVVPYAYGALGKSRVLDRLSVPAGYAGSLLFPFAAAGLVGRDRRRYTFLVLAAIGLAVHLRLPGVADFVSKLPLFDIAVNDYFIFLSVFGLAGLAVLGATRLTRGEGAQPFVAGAVTATLAVLVIVAVRAPALAALGMDGGYLRERLLCQVGPLAAGALLVGVLARRGRLGARTVAVLAMVFVAGRRVEEAGVYPTYPATALHPRLALLDPIPRGRPVRMMALHDTFTPNIAASYGVEDVRGYEAMTLRRYADLYALWCTQLPAFYNRVDDPATPFASFLGVRYVVVPPGSAAPAGWPVLAEERGSRLVENPKALPRAFAPAHVAWIGDGQKALFTTQTIQDFANDGVVGAARPGPIGWLPNGPADVEVSGYVGDRLALSIVSRDPVFVGTSVPAWKGWRLSLDGVRAPLLPFDHAFLGFQVPRGRHEAVLRYLPDGFLYGSAISGATALACIALLLRTRRRGPAPTASRLA